MGQRISPPCTGHISLQEGQLESDIKTYVEDHLGQNLAFPKFPASILADIKRGPRVPISRNVSKIGSFFRYDHGPEIRFRWVVCRLETLASCPNPASLRKALESRPPTLNRT